MALEDLDSANAEDIYTDPHGTATSDSVMNVANTVLSNPALLTKTLVFLFFSRLGGNEDAVLAGDIKRGRTCLTIVINFPSCSPTHQNFPSPIPAPRTNNPRELIEMDADMNADKDNTPRFTALILMPCWISDAKITEFTVEDKERLMQQCSDKFRDLKKMILHVRERTRDETTRQFLGM